MRWLRTLGAMLALACLCGAGRVSAQEPGLPADEAPAREMARIDLERAEAMEAQARAMMQSAETAYESGRLTRAELGEVRLRALDLLREAVEIRARLRTETEASPLPGLPLSDPILIRRPPDGQPPDPETARLLAELHDLAGRSAPPAPRVIVVPSGAMEEERVGTLLQDLGIMATVLQKALTQALGPDAMPGPAEWPFAPLIDGRPEPNLYLEGYGALFVTSVRFPLGAPPQVAPPEPEPQPESLWEQTRRELHGPPPPLTPRPGRPGGRFPPGVVEPPFRPERVEKLKDVVLETLKEARNIRGLEPGESVSVVVLGPAGPLGANALTIRVEKADVDAFAEGHLTADQFRGRATIAIR